VSVEPEATPALYPRYWSLVHSFQAHRSFIPHLSYILKIQDFSGSLFSHENLRVQVQLKSVYND
jgi:hypothetical protein